MTPVFRREDGDTAFERLYARHVRDVYRYAAAMLDDAADAEDVTQTTFLNAYRSFDSGVRPERPRSWLLAIAHNVCRQRFRQAQRRPREVAFDEGVGDGHAVEEPATPSVEDLRKALGQLPANQRTALVMRELEGGSYAEIAEVLGISVSALETLLFRARQALREQLEENLSCHEAALAIHRQLDGRLPLREKSGLRAHLRACGDCTSLAQSLRAQRRALKTLVLVPVPASMSRWVGHETAATATGASGAGGLTAAGAVTGGGAGASSAVLAGAVAKMAAMVIAGIAIGGGTYTGVVIASNGASHDSASAGRDGASLTSGEVVSVPVKGTPASRTSLVRAHPSQYSAATVEAAAARSSVSTSGSAGNFGSGQTSDPATASGGSPEPPGDVPSANTHVDKGGQPTAPGQAPQAGPAAPLPAHAAKGEQAAPPGPVGNAEQTAPSAEPAQGETPGANDPTRERPKPNANANVRATVKPDAPGRTRPSAPPGQARPDGTRGQAKPDASPGQTRAGAPPGQTKSGTTAPPRQTKADAPPGQTRTDASPGQTKPDAPSGQARPDAAPPPGQAKPDAPPGQNKPDAPPGQTKPDTTPPGQTKPDPPPGQENKPDAPPGQVDQNPPPAQQDPAPELQAQDTHSQGNKPPDPPGRR